MNAQNIPSYFRRWEPQFIAWYEICSHLKSLPQHVAFNYVLSNPYIDKVLIGIESLSQLTDLMSCASFVDYGTVFDDLSLADPEILNPSLWKLDN